MATFSRVTPNGWEQGDDASTSSRVTPTGWSQVAAAGGGTTIACTLGAATANGYAANVDANRTIAAGVGTATASGYQASVSNSLDTTINAGLASAAASGYQANVDANRTIAAGLGTATASGFAASVSNTNDTVISVSVATAAAVGYAASLNVNRTIAAALGTSQALGYAATVSNGDAGGGHGFSMGGKKRRIVKVRWNGYDYTMERDALPAFLESIQEQAAEKVTKKRNAKKKPAPLARIVSAPAEELPDLQARIAAVNKSIGALWGVDEDEDEELLWLMV